MSPNVRDSDFVLVVSSRFCRLKPGKVVVVQHQKLGTIIKRIAKRSDRKLLLAGDNLDSTSSQDIGWVDEDALVGVVVWHIASAPSKC